MAGMGEAERILVTGGAGMIGSNLVKRLVRAGFNVSVIDNLWRGKREYLLDEDGNYVIDMVNRFYEIDLSGNDSIDSIIAKVDYIFHLADVVAGVDYVFSNQGSVFRQNLLINSNLITAVRKHPVKGFIYVGTACSFPASFQTGVDASPLKEENQYPAFPESSYGWSKLMGEYESFLMEQETGIPVSVLTLHNVYGTPCDFGMEKSQVIPSLVRKAIEYPKNDFVVWGSGEQGRAFVHVDDVVDALMLTMEKGFGKGLIQIGPDFCTPIKDIAELIKEISGKNMNIIYDTTKPEGDRGRCADYSKAKQILGWEPSVELRKGLAGLYRWIEARVTE